MELERIKEILYNYYEIEDDYDAQSGCYINNTWLSINEILDVIETYY